MNRLYDFQCIECGYEWEEMFLRVSIIPRGIPCKRCKGYSERKVPVIKCNMGVGAYGYYDENLGVYVNTNRQREEVMREQGVTFKGDTPKNEKAWV